MAFALLETARINRRNFALIHFSGKGSVQTDIFPAGQASFEDTMTSAETFLDGGTDYESPLREALRLVQADFRNADVVFITDGECAVSDCFAEEFREAKTARKFTVTGLLLDKGSTGFAFSLEPFCDRIYRTSQLIEDDIVRDLLKSRT